MLLLLLLYGIIMYYSIAYNSGGYYIISYQTRSRRRLNEINRNKKPPNVYTDRVPIMPVCN